MRLSRCALGLVVTACASAADPVQTTVLTLGGSTAVSSAEDSSGAAEESSSSGDALESSSGGVASSSSEGGDEGSTTMVAPTDEICDGLDNDQDGLIDEVSLMNTTCQGCELRQLAGFAFWVCDTRITWEEAQAECQDRGAELASVHSLMESDLIFGVFADVDDDDTWIGLNDRAEEGTYVWSDGTDFGYDNWGVGEPNDADDSNDCVTIRAPEADWNDTHCDNVFRFACKAPHV